MRWLAILSVLMLAMPAAPVAAQDASAAAAAPIIALPPPPPIRLMPDGSRRMTVDVLLDGKGPFPFLVDTGSEATVVSRELAGALALPPAGPARMVGVTGAHPVERVHVGTLSVDRHRAAGLRAPVLDQAMIGGAGMIGIDTLQRHRLTMDFRRRAMTIEPSARRQRAVAADADEIVIQGRSRRGRLVIAHARVDGKRVTMVLDTGSQMSIGNEALRRALAGRRDAKEAPVVITDVGGGQLAATIAVAHRVQIDGLSITTLPLALVDAPIFAFLGLNDQPAMLLGMDAMHLFERVSIDFARRQARFERSRG